MTERRHVFDLPSVIVSGWGAAAGTGEQVQNRGARRVLVVIDPGVRQTGLAEPVYASLDAAGIQHQSFTGVEPQPSVQNVRNCVAALAQARADLIVAVGGGSAMDVAKCARLLADNGGEPIDYWGTGRSVAAPSVPLVCLPTTAGTGSEVSPFAVVNDLERNEKVTLGHRNLAPQLAMIDPELHLTCPPVVTAHAGVDALTHALEAYTSQLATPFTDGIALQAIELCGQFLIPACRDGADRAARSGMAAAATLAGVAFSNALLGLCHAISGPLGKYLHLSHGLANAVLLPHVLAFNLPAAPEKMARAARALGAANVASAATDLLAALRLPLRLGAVGLTPELIPLVAQGAEKSINFKINPRPVDVPAVVEILQRAL